MRRHLLVLPFAAFLLCGTLAEGAYNVKTLFQEWNTAMSDDVDCDEYTLPLLGFGMDVYIHEKPPGYGSAPYDGGVVFSYMYGSDIQYKVNFDDENGSGAIQFIGPYASSDPNLYCLTNTLPAGCDGSCPTCLECGPNDTDCCAEYMTTCQSCECEIAPQAGIVVANGGMQWGCSLPSAPGLPCDYDCESPPCTPEPECTSVRSGTILNFVVTAVSFDTGANWMTVYIPVNGGPESDCGR